jgi:hypothetical protein
MIGLQERREQKEPKLIRSPGTRWRACITWALLPVPVLLAAGCGGGPPGRDPGNGAAASGPAAAPAPGIVDPLSEITDKNDRRYLSQAVNPLLHARGAGPSRFRLRADAGMRSVRVYIACAPVSSFRATVGEGFSAWCASRFQNFADIPVRPGKIDLEVKIPEATRFVVLVIPTPTNT